MINIKKEKLLLPKVEEEDIPDGDPVLGRRIFNF